MKNLGRELRRLNRRAFNLRYGKHDPKTIEANDKKINDLVAEMKILIKNPTKENLIEVFGLSPYDGTMDYFLGDDESMLS